MWPPTDGRPTLSPQEIADVLATFHYDLTASTSATHFTGLASLVPYSQLLVGLDNPYMPRASFASAIKAIESWSGFDELSLDALAFRNAVRLFPALGKRTGLSAA